VKQKHKSDTTYSCEGVPIHAAKGLHELATDVISNRCKGRGKVLDLGCGSGAFSKRMQTLGFATTSVDLSLDTFSLNSESCEVDFNSDFAERFSREKFDVIVALEVIEHLENPQHFLRQLKLMANSDTVILVSFPNIYLYSSVYSFFRNGTFGNWSPALYWETGHQTILTDWLFEEHLKKTGLALEEKHFCATFHPPSGHWVKSLLHKLFLTMVCILNPAISSKARKSEVVLFVIGNKPSSAAGAA
jgi:2-polyprenyl-3-methyl-5-hydroxy-6-metoxy-1,4-benzoquinol methylase